ncbi:MAG: hypothetical protein QNJ44_11375 [Rhodobacter sp.]|nr:hypothetical protein [Rhodobacter sp.]
MLYSQPFFWRTLPDGRREVSWRVWVLIWVAPVLFLIAGAGMLLIEGYRHLASTPATGEVVRVYAWEGETVFDRGTTNYGPVFRYLWSDGQPTEATSGMSHPEWNFDIGSTHDIRYFPGRKANVVFPGPHNWYAGLIVGAIGLVLSVPALWASLRIRRWLGAGA